MGYYEASLALREQWMADDYDEALAQIKGRKNGLVLSVNGAKHLKYRPWGVNPDGSVTISGNGSLVCATHRAEQNIAGDLDVRVRVAVASSWQWTGAIEVLACKANHMTDLASSWSLTKGYTFVNGSLTLYWIENGVARQVESSASLASAGLPVGSLVWLRAKLELSGGTGGVYVVRFYYSTTDTTDPSAVVWTQLGVDRLGAAATTVQASTYPVALGDRLAGALTFAGRIQRANVLDGTRTALDFDASKIKNGPFYDDGLGNYWYGMGSAAWGDHLYLPSTFARNNAQTPHSANLAITGNIDVRVLTAADDWTPSSRDYLVSKWVGSGGQDCWILNIETSSRPRFVYSPNGTDAVLCIATASPFVSDTAPLWLRVTRSSVTGNVTFYTSRDNMNWSQLGDVVPSAPGPIFAGTTPLAVGPESETGSSNMPQGKFYRAQVFASLDGTDKRADVRFDKPLKWSNGQHTDSQGNVWTINRSALQSRLKVVANSYVQGFGTINDSITTLDAAELDITGDIDLRWRGSLDDWTPAVEQYLIQKGHNSGNESLRFTVATSGQIWLTLSPSGLSTDTTATNSGVIAGIADGAIKWVRTTWRQSDGRVQFFLSDDGVAWTQLGTDKTLAIASIASSSGNLEIGGRRTGTHSAFTGKVYEAQVWKGIPGVSSSARLVANPKFTALTSYAPYKEPSYVAIPSLPTVAPFSTPHNAAFNPTTGIFDVRVRIALDSVASGSNQALAAKYTSASGGGWAFRVSSTGVPYLTLADGVSAINVLTTASIPASLQGVLAWYRFTYDTATQELLFYYSLDGLAWTPIGTPVTHTAVPAVYSSTVITTVGTRNSTSDPAAGRAAELVIISNGVTVVSMSATNLLDGQAAFVDGSGFTWTVDGGARIERRTWTFTRAGLSARAELRTGRYAYLPGAATNTLTTPVTPENSIPGDIDYRILVALDDWTPATDQGLYSNSSGRGFRISATTGFPRITWQDSVGGFLSAAGNAAIPAFDGQEVWVRVTRDNDGGPGGVWRVAFYWSLDGVTWTQVGTNVDGAIPANETDFAYPTVGAFYVSGSPTSGRIRALELRDGVNGTIVAGWDLRDAMLMPTEPHNGFTDLYGNVWTVNRAAAGLKTSVVDRTKFLVGSGSYLQALDNAMFNFTPSESFTIAVLTKRQPGGTAIDGAIIAKRAHRDNSALCGWAIRGSHGASNGYGIVDDGTNRAFVQAGSSGVIGTTEVVVLRRNVATDTVEIKMGSGAVGTMTDPTTSVISGDSAMPVRLGASGSTTVNHPMDMEILGTVILTGVVSDADIATLFDPDLELSIGPVGDIASGDSIVDPFSLQMRLSGAGDIASGESFGYPDYLKHGEFFADDFPEPDGALDVTQWLAENPRSSDLPVIEGSRLMLRAWGNNGVSRATPLFVGSYKNMDLLALVQMVIPAGGDAYVWIRADDFALDGNVADIGLAYALNGYGVRLSGASLFLSKSVNGVLTSLGSIGGVDVVTAPKWLRFRAVGTTIYVKVWSGVEPAAWNLVAQDSEIQAPGKALFAMRRLGGTNERLYLDNLAIADVQNIALVGDISSQESVGGIAVMRIGVGPISVPDSYAAPTLHQVQQRILVGAGVASGEDVGGLQTLSQRISGLGNIESEETVWGQGDEIEGRVAFELPYDMEMEIQ